MVTLDPIAGDNGGESRENVLWARTPLSPLCTAPLVPYFLNWKLETKTQYISILADGSAMGGTMGI